MAGSDWSFLDRNRRITWLGSTFDLLLVRLQLRQGQSDPKLDN